MCQNSVNTTQMQQAIEQAEMTVKLAQNAVHQLKHNASHFGDESLSEGLRRAGASLAVATEELAQARAAASPAATDTTTVELV